MSRSIENENLQSENANEPDSSPNPKDQNQAALQIPSESSDSMYACNDLNPKNRPESKELKDQRAGNKPSIYYQKDPKIGKESEVGASTKDHMKSSKNHMQLQEMVKRWLVRPQFDGKLATIEQLAKRQERRFPDDVLSLKLTEDGGVHTRNLAIRLEYELQQRNITKKLFAERVLNRGFSTVANLIKHPKPWKELRSGRDVYLQAQKWLFLSPEDQEKVLKGEETGFKILEKSNPKREQLTDDALELQLEEGPNILTHNLARNILYQLQTKKIPQSTFFKGLLGSYSSQMSTYLSAPKAYEEMSEGGKKAVQKMLHWAKMINDDQIEVLAGVRAIPEPSDSKIPEDILKLQLEDDEKILTINVATRIFHEIKARGISKKKFAKAVMDKSECVLYNCINKPSSWDKLFPAGRHNFRCLVSWLKMTEEEKAKALEIPKVNGGSDGSEEVGESSNNKRPSIDGSPIKNKKHRSM